MNIDNFSNDELDQYINLNVKKVYLHIGMHKTATTSIEETLSFNKDFLEENDYFVTKRWNANLSIPLKSIFDVNPEKIHYHIAFNRNIDEINEFNKTELHLWLEEMRATECSNVIISGDWLSGFIKKESVENLKFLLDTIFPNAETKVVFVTRERNSFINSVKQELIKGNHSLSDITDNDYRKLYKTYVNKYLELYARENIIAYKFEDSIKYQTGPVGYFLKQINFSENEIEKISIKKVNESLSDKSINLIFYINGKVPFYLNNKKNILRNFGDTKYIWEIRGGKFTLDAGFTKEIFYKGLNDIDWLNDNLNITYPKEIPNQDIDKEILFDADFLEDIKEIFPLLTNVIKKLTYDYIIEKFDKVENVDSKIVLNILRDWVTDEFPDILDYDLEKLGEIDPKMVDDQKVDNIYKTQFLNQDFNEKNYRNADFFRDIALLCERYNQSETAFYFMSKAKYYRPSESIINEKLDEYRKKDSVYKL